MTNPTPAAEAQTSDQIKNMPGWSARRSPGGQWTVFPSHCELQMTIDGGDHENSAVMALAVMRRFDACAGMTNPAAELATLQAKAALCEEMATALKRLFRAFELDLDQDPQMDILTCWDTNSQAIKGAQSALARYNAAKEGE